MQKLSERLLLIFIKNPRKGKVKTRLAATLGDEKALGIYKKLLVHTRSVVQPLGVQKQVWYSDFIPELDRWPEKQFEKKLQQGINLGERMRFAFQQAFEEDYKKVVIIGGDCAQLQTGHIEKSFQQLENYEAVIGPSADGGYYLLGLRRLLPQLFDAKPWGTSAVLQNTLADLKKGGNTHFMLEELTDVDTEADWEKFRHRF